MTTATGKIEPGGRARSATPARRPIEADRLGLAGLGLLVALVVVAVAAPLLAPFDPLARVGVPFARPGGGHLLGTDDVGHDLFSVLVYGSRVTLVVGVAAAAVATLLGTTVGLVAGWARGWVDAVAMRAVDVVLSLPFLPLMIVVGVFLGPGLRTEVLVIAAVMWAGPARELRSQVLSVRERDHVQAARSMGASHARVLAQHIAPTVVPIVVPQFVLAAKRAILFEAALSFLGLGAASTPSWGTMLSTAQARSAFLTDAWLWWVVPPGIGIAVAVLAFAFLGHGFEERTRAPSRHRGMAARVATSPTSGPAPTTPPSPVAPGQDRGATSISAGRDGRGEDRLVVDRLVVTWPEARDHRAVDGVSLTVAVGEVLGLVGESGAGKSTLAAAMAGLLPARAEIEAGTVWFSGRDLLATAPRARRRLWGDRIAVIPQDAADALDPVHRVGAQVAEAITTHYGRPDEVVRARVTDLLGRVGLDPAHATAWPHELSGGMRQRVVIAMALANDPDLLIADEPTSGLDVVLQAELVDLLASLRAATKLSLVLVTHDLPLVLAMADRVAVMQQGRLVEVGSVATIAHAPRHEHTRALLAAVPRLPRNVVQP